MIKPRKNIMEMDEYRPPLEGRRGFLRLDFNENTVGPSPKVTDVLKKISEADLAAYPEYSKFQSKLAAHFDIDENELLITNATDEAIMVIMQTYLSEGDEILIPTPTFAMFRFYAQISGAEIREVLYNKDLTFPTRQVLDKISSKTRIVVLCNPNNPTATLIDKEDIIEIIEKAGSNDALVLLDEAYYEFSRQTMLDKINRYSNLIILRTFSKAMGLGGLRLGCAIANKKVIAELSKVRSPYSINMAAVKAGEAAIDDQDYVKWYINEIEKGKKLIYGELDRLKIKIYPSSANFFLAQFKDPLKVCRKLKEKGILVRDRSTYPLLQNCIRISIGTEKQMRQLANALKEPDLQ